MTPNEISKVVLDASMKVHSALGGETEPKVSSSQETLVAHGR